MWEIRCSMQHGNSYLNAQFCASFLRFYLAKELLIQEATGSSNNKQVRNFYLFCCLKHQ